MVDVRTYEKKLPRLYAITAPAPREEFFVRLERILAAGIRLIQLRLPGLSEREYSAYAKPALELCRNYDAQLMLNCALDLALQIGATGIHLSAMRLAILRERPAFPLVAASCHNSAEILRAQEIGVDFAVLSSVLATMSHPNALPLGWKRFQELTAAAGIPIYALGGMTRNDYVVAQSYGAYGIALLSAIWNNAGEINNVK